MLRRRLEMDVIAFYRKKFSCLHGVGLLLLGCSLVGCALPGSPPPKAITPSAGDSAKQLPIRAIIYFQRPTADNKFLSAAISEACNCQPVFFRHYLADALIYEITLPQGETLAAFEKALMLNAVQLGIKAVEQDRIMQHQ